MTVTPLYAALLALMLVALSARVILARRSEKVALGDGGNTVVLRRARVQANFAEYAPMVLILMALAEVQDVPDWRLHLIGLLFVAGRLAHAAGVSREPEDFRFRVAGMVLTFAALISGAMINLGGGSLSGLMAGG